MQLPLINKKKITKEEWLQLIPVADCQHEWVEDKIVLLIPRAKNPILKFFVSFLNSKPYFRLKLDEVGSFVWQQIDGHRTIDAICRALEQEFNNRVDPADERTVEFFKRLYMYRAVHFLIPQKPGK